MYQMRIFSFREYLEVTQKIELEAYNLENLVENHETIVHDIMNGLTDKKILKLYDEFVNVGVYPFYFEDKSKYIDRIHETINTVLYKDLGRLFNIQADKIDTLKKLLLTICVSKPLELSIDKLASTVGISKMTLYKYIEYLGRAELVHHISHEAKRFKAIRKPDKLYLANTNLFSALCNNQEIGTVRESYFVSMLSSGHRVHYVEKGDFLIDEKFTVEVGGANKSFKQIKDLEHSFVVKDKIESGFKNSIPLWLFRFLR
jgi:predicted AAA+ superfamily ATPase